MNINTFDHNNFESCVNRGIELLEKRKYQMISEGYKFNTCLKSIKWAIEQSIINRESSKSMMSAVIDFVEMIESREEYENNI